MTPEFKEKWIEALRSGRYMQAHGVMKDIEGRMCCLGVAADLIDASRWNPFPKQGSSVHPRLNGYGWSGDDPWHIPAIANSLDIEMKTTKKLASMNDDDGYSFVIIADWIEANL